MEKPMLLYRKLWNFDLLWKKLWYYGKNYDTIPKTVELDLVWKTLWYYGKNCGTIVNYSLL